MRGAQGGLLSDYVVPRPAEKKQEAGDLGGLDPSEGLKQDVSAA